MRHKFLTLSTVLSIVFVSFLSLLFSCKKDSGLTIHGVWRLEKYSCNQFSNYRTLTFYFDTAFAHSDSAWYIDPLVQLDTVVVKYKLNTSTIEITDPMNVWSGTFPFKFNSAKLLEITRPGTKCGDETYLFYK